MRVRYVGEIFGVDGLTSGKEYDVIAVDEDSGWLRVIDDSGEDYLYSPTHPRPVAVPNHPGGRFDIVQDDAEGSLRKAISGV